MSRMPNHGLYVITDAAAGNGTRLVSAVAAAIAGGAAVVQYRDKSGDDTRRLADSRSLLQCCREAGVPLIINDDIALAVACGADGVHLGRDDGDVATARARLGAAAIIGVSCYNEPERAIAAQRAGADYVAFGRFFPSASKPAAVQAKPDLLQAMRPRLSVPIVAIGGITADNGGMLLDAGADLLAVIGAVLGQPHPESAARAFAALFSTRTTGREAI